MGERGRQVERGIITKGMLGPNAMPCSTEQVGKELERIPALCTEVAITSSDSICRYSYTINHFA